MDPFEEGRAAFANSETKSDNPYLQTVEPNEWEQWDDGFNYEAFGD